MSGPRLKAEIVPGGSDWQYVRSDGVIELVARYAVRTEGEGRTLAFASDISPHWAPREFMDWAGYGPLFGQAVTWLAG